MRSFYRALSIFSVFIIPILLFVFFVIYRKDTELYMFLTEEDQILEWLTFVFLFLSGVLSFVIAGIRKKSGAPYFLFFLGFGVACLLFALEEISWGQRLFGAAPPEFFIEHSDQKEINIHNVIQKQFNLKTKFVASRVLFYYGTVFPILVYDRRIRGLFKRLRFVVPPVVLALGFLIGALLMNDKPTGREEELGELFFSICFLLFMMLEYASFRIHGGRDRT